MFVAFAGATGGEVAGGTWLLETGFEVGVEVWVVWTVDGTVDVSFGEKMNTSRLNMKRTISVMMMTERELIDLGFGLMLGIEFSWRMKLASSWRSTLPEP